MSKVLGIPEASGLMHDPSLTIANEKKKKIPACSDQTPIRRERQSADYYTAMNKLIENVDM